MRLLELLDGVNVIRCKQSLYVNVEHIICDHRRARKNSIFVAIKGTKRNGNHYIQEAVSSGCIAVVTDDENFCIEEIPYILVKNARETIAKMWSNYYHNPSKDIKTIAITGTNGKTSSAFMLYNILREAKICCGLISTVGCFINGVEIDTYGGGMVSDISAAMTTPDPEILCYLYNKMKEMNVKYAVIEASSHALVQQRLSSIEIEIGAFTNLSMEHLDYHKNLEEYFSAKEKLFELCKIGIINVDDEYGKRLKEKYINSYSYSIKENSDFKAECIALSSNGCNYKAKIGNKYLDVNTNIIGEFTVYNTLLAVSCATLLGVDDESIKQGISKTINIKGRMEKYGNKPIYIDYAHTPKAMEKVILTIKKFEKDKRIIVLFGCGGDRDKGKRAEMGKIATELSDFTVITSDNPRTEDPYEIIEEIKLGIKKEAKYMVIQSRREAITYVAKELGENDVLLLLGKGHEDYEITKEGKQKFSEREILDEVFSFDK